MPPKVRQIDSLRSVDNATVHANRQRRFKRVNMPFAIVAGLLVLVGLFNMYAAVSGNDNYSFNRQLLGVVVGVVAMVLVARYDYHRLSGYTTLFLIVNIVLILMPHVPLIGLESKGAQSWVNIAGVSFQPGEFAKVTVILLAASVVSRYGGKLGDTREYLKALGILTVPFICIMTQPDLGTGLVYLFIAAIALIVGGARPKYLLVTLGVLAGVVVAVLIADPLLDAAMGTDVLLKDYQKARLLVFLDSSYDPTGEGYNLTQAKIAIGSGGILGKGFMNATQSSLGFLPEAPTDFVFCVYAEQFGFLGSLFLLALYLGLVLISLQIARGANDLFGSLIVSCVVGMWVFQVLENIGMTCGLMPITGIPLPFMSFGSSFMLVNFVLLGLIHSVWSHSGR